MNTNNLTLLIDGNWFMISRVYQIQDRFHKGASPEAIEVASQELKQILSKSISAAVNRIPIITHVVLVADKGSWRKHLPIPDQLEVSYKGNREYDEGDTDWGAIFAAYQSFLEDAKDLGLLVSQEWQVEGDDWMYYWSTRLNREGSNCLIWTSDQDLKQLICNYDGVFTAWYNERSGLYYDQSFEIPDDPLAYFLGDHSVNHVLDLLQRMVVTTSPFEPYKIVIYKVLSGDSGDNIKSVVRKTTNNRTYRFTESDVDKMFAEIGWPRSIEEFLDRQKEIATYISRGKKFKGYPVEHILEMISYNMDLVWISRIEQVGPWEECKKYDGKVGTILVEDLKNNALLLVKDMDIEDIFRS